MTPDGFRRSHRPKRLARFAQETISRHGPYLDIPPDEPGRRHRPCLWAAASGSGKVASRLSLVLRSLRRLPRDRKTISTDRCLFDGEIFSAAEIFLRKFDQQKLESYARN
jgi:hypothetical protein